MIKRYVEHAANERTYLAWVRTALAIAAFGFFVDKFSSWVTSTAESGRHVASTVASHAGLWLVVISFVILVGSTVRFVTTTRRIDSDKEFTWRYTASDVLLGISLAAIAAVVIILMGHVIYD